MVQTRSRTDREGFPPESSRTQRRRLDTITADDHAHVTAPAPKPLSELLPAQAPPLPAAASPSSSKRGLDDHDQAGAGAEGTRQSLRRRGAQTKPRRGPQLVASGKGAELAAARAEAEREAMAAFTTANAVVGTMARDKAELEDKENAGRAPRKARRSMSDQFATAGADARNTFLQLEQSHARPTLNFSAATSAAISPSRAEKAARAPQEEREDANAASSAPCSQRAERAPPSSAPAIGNHKSQGSKQGPAVLVPASLSTKASLSHDPTPHSMMGPQGEAIDSGEKRILAPSSSPLRGPSASAPSSMPPAARSRTTTASTSAAVLVRESPDPRERKGSALLSRSSAPPLSPPASPRHVLVPNSSPTPEARRAELAAGHEDVSSPGRIAAESSAEESQGSDDAPSQVRDPRADPEAPLSSDMVDGADEERLDAVREEPEAEGLHETVQQAMSLDEDHGPSCLPQAGDAVQPQNLDAERTAEPAPGNTDMRVDSASVAEAKEEPQITSQLAPLPTKLEVVEKLPQDVEMRDAHHEREELAQVEKLLEQTQENPDLVLPTSTEPRTVSQENAVGQEAPTPRLAPSPFSSSQNDLLQGLGSDDFEDITLSPDEADKQQKGRPLQQMSRDGAQRHQDSPTLATRSFKRSLSHRKGAADAAQPAHKVARTSGPDSDDEFNDDSGFWEGVGGDLDWAETSAVIPSSDKGKSKANAPLPGFAPLRLPSASTRVPQTPAASRSSYTDEDDYGPVEPKPPPTFGFKKASGTNFNVSAAALAAAERRLAAWDAKESNLAGPSSRALTPAPRPVIKQGPTAAPVFAPPRATPTPGKAASFASKPATDLSTAPGTLPPANMSSTPPTTQTEKRAALTAAVSSPRPAPQLLRTPNPVTPRGAVTPSVAAMASRISLGMTPRGSGPSGRGGARPKFTTPFKDAGKRAALGPGSTASGSPWTRPLSEDIFKVPAACSQRPTLFAYDAGDQPTAPSAAVVAALRGGPSKHNAPVQRRGQAVFNLEPPAEGRKGMAEYGIRPEATGAAEVEELAEELPHILGKPTLAEGFAFIGPNDEDLGVSQALEELHRVGAVHVDLAWVKNHWGLILWKLASLSAAMLHELDDRWSWTEAIRQLRYRYEREINLAQRSAVKRIQEHDSPASLSMVLCVHTIVQDDHVEPDGGTAPILLELSDGWYRIRAEADVVLQRAISKGHIKRGSKLAICGAKLISAGSGTEVLQAFDTSVLRICGNATSLARWDARLGFAPRPFVATLRSITPDGGIVPLMDIIITRIYPIAYVDTGTSSQRASGINNARSEEDEAEAAQAWEQAYEREKATIEAEYSNCAGNIESVQHALGDMARYEESEGYEADTETCERLFHRLLDAPDPRAFIDLEIRKKGLDGLLPALARLADDQARMERSEVAEQAQRELRTRCPPRGVRSFRICRFRDAQVPLEKGGGQGDEAKPRKAQRSKRSVQLTVWDVVQLGSGFLVEGGRYTVTSLSPSTMGAWRGPDEAADVFLSTRKESRWKRLE